MKIIGSGFGRTGTLSLKKALEQLRFGPCYHMMEVASRSKHVKLWHDVAMGKPGNWEEIFQAYQSTVDFPASVYYKEIFEIFPEAKVIHTVRDPERWYSSTKETIYTAHSIFPTWFIKWVRPIRIMMEMQEKIIWQHLFEGRFEDKAFALEIFHHQTEEVKKIVPTEQLLIFSVKDGWEPLCNFLDVPIPDTPFPRVNDRRSMQNRFRLARLTIRLGLPLLLTLIALGIYFLLRGF